MGPASDRDCKVRYFRDRGRQAHLETLLASSLLLLPPSSFQDCQDSRMSANGLTSIGSRDKSVGWYDAPITTVEEPVRDLLETYSHVPPGEVVSRCVEMVSDPANLPSARRMDAVSPEQSSSS